MKNYFFVLMIILCIGFNAVQSQVDEIMFLSWSNDQTLLAIAKQSGIVEVFDVINNETILSTVSTYGTPGTIAWEPNNQRIATIHSDQIVRIWEVNSGILLHELVAYQILAIVWSPDNRLYVSNIEAGTFIWNMNTYQSEGILNIEAYAFSFSPDGRYLAVGGWSGSFIQDMLTGDKFGIQPYPELVHSLIWNSDGTQLAGIDILGNFGVWDLTTNQQETFFQMGRGVLMWWEENHLYTANDGTINVWDTTTWQIISSFPLGVGFFVSRNSTGDLYAEFSGNEIEIATYCEIIESNDISALSNAIVHGNSIQFNKQICLTENATYTLIAPLPTITGDITVIGNGAQIVMTGAGRVFDVASTGGLTLKNITVSGGNAVQGGAIYNAGDLTLENVVLENNSADDGGAIYNVGNLEMDGGAIQNNTATNFGGGIYNLGELDVDGVNIRDNDAPEGSGVYQGE